MALTPFHPSTHSRFLLARRPGFVVGGLLCAFALSFALATPAVGASESMEEAPATTLYKVVEAPDTTMDSRQQLLSSARPSRTDHVIYLSDGLAISMPDGASRALDSTKGTLLNLYGLGNSTASPKPDAVDAYTPFNQRLLKTRTNASAQEVEWVGERAVIRDSTGSDVNVREAVVEAVNAVEDHEDLSFNYTPDPEAAVAVEQAIATIEDHYDVGFIAVDLATGRTVSYASDTPLYAASTFKASYCAWLLSQKVDSGEVPISHVEQLVHDTIVDSDNTTYLLLRSMFGYGEYSDWLSQVSAGDFANLAYPTYSASDLARIWALDADYLLSGEGASSWLRTLHLHSAQSSIDEAVNDSDVYTKAGWIDEGGYRALNDAGVIMDFDGSPTLLVILSSATPEDHPLLINLVQALRSV